MDFFGQQDQAHRQSRKLLWLFFLAVIVIVMAVDAAVAGIWLMGFGGRLFSIWDYPPQYLLTSTTVVLLFIGSGTLYEMYRLRDGGDAVAKMAGGRLINAAGSRQREFLADASSVQFTRNLDGIGGGIAQDRGLTSNLVQTLIAARYADCRNDTCRWKNT